MNSTEPVKTKRPRINKGVLICTTRGKKVVFFKHTTIIEYFRPLSLDRVRRIILNEPVQIPAIPPKKPLFKYAI